MKIKFDYKRNNKNKVLRNSQFDIINTLIFLLFLFFFIVLGLLLYFDYWQKKIKEQKEFLRKISYFSIAERFISLPYLNCGRITEKFSCMDYYKIKNFQNLLGNEEISRSVRALLFKQGQKKIIAKIIFEEGLNRCSINNLEIPSYLNCYFILYNETLVESNYYEKKDVIRVPILIRYKDSSNIENSFEYVVAILEIESYW